MKFVTTSTTFNVPNDTVEAVFSAKYSMDGEEEVWEITATIEEQSTQDMFVAMQTTALFI